jgi:type II restriction/modification system DNA methylase subunit YeeA
VVAAKVKRLSIAFGVESGATPEQILDLKVCDPAMGSGAFLVEALSERTEELWRNEPK